MVDYEIQPVALNDPRYKGQILALIAEALDTRVTLNELLANTSTGAERPSVYLAALKGGEVIGFNAFISHDLIWRERPMSCFQSCWTATSGRHRGKKIFQNLILTAHAMLRDQGAEFVFGFPNENSRPIFTKKLGYHERPSVLWRMPNIPKLRDSWFDPGATLVTSADTIGQNDPQLIAWKAGHHESDQLFVVEEDGSLVWGLRRTRPIGGLAVPYLDIGGLVLRRAVDARPLVKALMRQAGWVAFAQLTATRGNSLLAAFQRVGPSKSNVTIWYDLQDTMQREFDFFGGVRDVF